MIHGLLFRKTEMKQVFDAQGRATPVTILRALANTVAQVRTKEKDGYQAVCLAVAKPRISREVPLDNPKEVVSGKAVKVEDVFREGELVKVRGKSKGRGFSGVVKRWGFATQPRTHGQSDRVRAPGSIGAQTPGRVIKGKKMPGHYGFQRTTVKNLTLLKVDPSSQEIWVKGAVPGPRKGILLVLTAGKKDKKFVQQESHE